MPTQQLLDGLNHALNREVSTAMRYVIQSATIKGAQWESARNAYRSDINDEVGHAVFLADKIAMLGGDPTLDPDLTPPPKDVRAMLKNDIEQEKLDADHYLKLAGMAEGEGLAELKVKLEEQAADEARHRDELRRLLGD